MFEKIMKVIFFIALIGGVFCAVQGFFGKLSPEIGGAGWLLATFWMVLEHISSKNFQKFIDDIKGIMEKDKEG